jgi:CBS domain-containing protein
MSLLNVGSRSPVTVRTTATAAEVARLMEDRNVGSVVVLRGEKPVGIVTDRDLVIRVMSRGLAPAQTRIETVMSSKLETVSADRPPLAAAVHMRERGIRRLPIIGGNGELIGIVTHDDLVHHLGLSSGELGEAIAMRPAPHREG